MSKKLLLITIVIYTSIACVILFSKYIFREQNIHADIFPKKISTNEAVNFYDSTDNTTSVIWEFGNGDKVEQPSGKYTFTKAGTYKVRVTINKTNIKNFIIDVTKQNSPKNQNLNVSIYGDKSAITGQKVHFKTIGKGITWCEWYFNGIGKIESQSAETFYSYNKPGTYEVLLLTNLNPKHPKRHTITIEPAYKITENIILKPKEKGAKKAEEKNKTEFKDLLQEMSYGNNFINNYNFLLKKYLCSNPKTTVFINSKQESDFYSYCQGLQINSDIIIKEVVLEINPKTNCTQKIQIKQ